MTVEPRHPTRALGIAQMVPLDRRSEPPAPPRYCSECGARLRRGNRSKTCSLHQAPKPTRDWEVRTVERYCASRECGKQLPLDARPDRRFCGTYCRRREMRLRQAER